MTGLGPKVEGLVPKVGRMKATSAFGPRPTNFWPKPYQLPALLKIPICTRKGSDALVPHDHAGSTRSAADNVLTPRGWCWRAPGMSIVQSDSVIAPTEQKKGE